MKKEFKILVLIILLFISSINAQITFENHFGGALQDVGYCVKQINNKYIIVGTTNSIGFGSMDAYLIFTDEYGNFIDSKTYGTVYNDFANEFEKTQDNGFIIVGWTKNSINHSNVYLIKTDSLGNEIWSKDYGLSNTNEGGWSVKQTGDLGYIIAGYNGFYVYLIKTNSIGDTLWTKKYGGLNYDSGNSIEITNDGGFIIAGYTQSYGQHYRSIYVIKTNSVGDTIWTQTHGYNAYNSASSIRKTNDNGFIITGTTGNDILGNDDDVFLLKIDSVGNQIWWKTYGENGAESGRSVDATKDNGYIIAGGTNSFGSGSFDGYIIKTNNLGDTIWTKTFGGPNSDYLHSLVQTSDSGYIACGYTQNFEAIGPDVYLIKLGGNGEIITGFNTVVIEKNIIYPFPNPASNFIHIKGLKAGYKSCIYSIFGQVIVKSYENSIDISSLKSGPYILKVFDISNNLIATNKIIKLE